MLLTFVLLVLFFCSGACGLIYEVVWARMLTVLFGTTLFAVSTVLSAFMAGLALGSFLCGRWIDRVGRPLRVFAALEGGIGLFALLFPWILSALGQFYLWLHPDQAGFYALFIRFLLCFLLLLIPTALMGATLPVVVKFGVQRISHLGRGVGTLYAINTLGAVSGVLLVTFLLMEWLGLNGSTYAAAAVNFLIAGLAWAAGKDQVVRREEAEEEAQTSQPDQPLIPGGVLGVVLGGFALSGFAALGYEVAWMRLLTVAFAANSHYEFSIILTAFLLGLGLGSLLCSRFLDARQDLLSLFGGTQILIGLLGVVSIPVFAALPGLVETARGARTWLAFEGWVFAVSTTLMLVPTLLMGATFPLVSRIYTRQLERVGRGVGDVGALNSMGAIGGAGVTGFVLIPLLGTEWSIKALAGLNLLVGLAVIGLHPFWDARRKQTAGAAAIVVLAVLLVGGPADVLRQASKPAPPSRLVYYEEGATGVVTVARSADGRHNLKVNGGGQVPSDYASLQLFRLLGHLPLLLHPDPQDVLVIAFGGGIALGSVAQHALRRIDCVEIAPGVLDAARQHFAEFNHHILDSLETSKVHITIDDGRNFLLTRPNSYHVITGDATHPTSADSWVLYTRDFYQLCKNRLTPDGIMAQWLPLHGLSVEAYKTILRTFQSVFPHATLWLTNDYAVILGTRQKVRLDWGLLKQKLRSDKVRQSLEGVNLGDPFALLSCFLMDAKTLKAYVGAGLLNTDDHPHISFLRSSGFKKTGWRVLGDVGAHRVRVFPFVKGIKRDSQTAVETRLEAYFQSKGYILQADILRMQRRGRSAFQAYRKALKLNPEDRTAAFFVGHLGQQIAAQYQRHLLARPKDAETRWQLGNLYAQLGRVEAAEKTFKKTVEMAPNYLKAYLSLSYLYAQKGLPDRALAVYRRAEDVAPDTPQVRASLKSAYEKIRRQAAAQQP